MDATRFLMKVRLILQNCLWTALQNRVHTIILKPCARKATQMAREMFGLRFMVVTIGIVQFIIIGV